MEHNFKLVLWRNMSRQINNIGISFILVVIFFLAIPSQVFSRDLRSIRDIDLLGITAYTSDGVMKIGFLYKNRDKDELVFWREGQLSIECQIFENTGNILRREKGSRIGIKSQRVNSFSQDIYWDVPRSHLNKDKWAIIECSTHTGNKKLTATDDVSLNN